MPHTGNNTFILPPDVHFWLTCNQKGSSHNFTLHDWQTDGFDLGSAEVPASSTTLASVLTLADELLGMSAGQRYPRILQQW